jgi:hypothetical protein
MSLEEALDPGIRAAFEAKYGLDDATQVVVAWTLQAEVTGVNGELYLHAISSRSMTPWRALGHVEAHAADLRASFVRSVEEL